jgi:hypothetical protein
MMGDTMWKCLCKRINILYCIRLCNSWNYVSIVYFYVLNSVCVCVLTGVCVWWWLCFDWCESDGVCVLTGVCVMVFVFWLVCVWWCLCFDWCVSDGVCVLTGVCVMVFVFWLVCVCDGVCVLTGVCLMVVVKPWGHVSYPKPNGLLGLIK